MARRPPAISSVSRASRGRRSVEVPTETAASTSARALIDFDPGRVTAAVTGPSAVGAVHGTSRRGLSAFSVTQNSLPVA